MTKKPLSSAAYGEVRAGIVDLVEGARRAAARSVNALMTASYWEIGRRIVEFQQGGAERAAYGEALLERLAADLTQQFGRGFSPVNLSQMRRFYLAWPEDQIFQTASEKSSAPRIRQTTSEKSRDAPSSTLTVNLGRTGCPLPSALVILRAPALSEKRCLTRLLRNRSPALRLDRAPTRAPDQQPAL